MKYSIGFLFMILSSLFACFGQLLWKISTLNSNYYILFVGFFLYGTGAIIMIIAYRFGKLSELQPVLSLNYVLGIILGVFILKEPITFLKFFGTVSIITGVLFIATSNK